MSVRCVKREACRLPSASKRKLEAERSMTTVVDELKTSEKTVKSESSSSTRLGGFTTKILVAPPYLFHETKGEKFLLRDNKLVMTIYDSRVKETSIMELLFGI